MIHVDLSKLRHDDNCRYWNDEEFCTCGAADYERLEIVTAQLTAAKTQIEDLQLRIRELEGALAKAKDIPMKYKRMEFNAQLQDENNVLGTALAAEREVSDKLEKALEMSIVGACAVGVPHNGERKVLQEAVDHARAALAEVSALRNANPAIQVQDKGQ